MNLAPLLHGSAGYLDELLICGGGLAVLLALVFMVESRRTSEKPPDDQKANVETSDDKGR